MNRSTRQSKRIVAVSTADPICSTPAPDPMPGREARANVGIIFALTLVHFTGDFYSSFIIPLLPLFITKFSLSLAQAGLIVGLSRFLAFVVQPPVGYLADRFATRLFALGGPLLVMVFISLTGIVPTYWALTLFVCIGSIGSSMFHPTVAGMIAPYSGRQFGFAMSLFIMGGTLSFGVGPLFITWFVENFGLEATPWTILLGLAPMIFLYRTVPLPEVAGFESQSLTGSIREVFGPVWKPVVLVFLIMVIRTYVSQSYLTFMPVLYAKEGYSLVPIGTAVSLFTVAGAVSGLLAGHYSDRFGFKPVFLVAHILTTPSMFLLLFLKGNWVYPGAFLTGFFALATIPLGVAMVQKLAPRGKSMASSLMTGLAYGVGGLLTPLTGMAADVFSIRTVLSILAVIPLSTIMMIILLPREH
jgi:FSR family fosmidomycin resistance protein-like MFS transporter